jgi:DNA-binding NarL/FixJ family response regulator
MTALLLADDHALIRRGLHDALADEGLRIAGEAGSWTELEPLLAQVAFDVLVLDIQLPGPSGLEILQTLAQRPAPPRTLVLSMYPEDPYALRALAAGACGYVTKSADPRVLVEAIRCVAGGGRWVSEAIARLQAAAAAGTGGAAHERLTARERLLLVLLAQGLPLPEVARHLAAEPRAVAVWRARLLEKMKMAGNAELAHYAVRHGLMAG